MWVDESGGTDTGTGHEGSMTVHVGGQEYQAEVNYDVNEDGVNDTAIIEHDDGTAQAFIDSDHDGQADHYAVLDETGHVVEQAVYDEASGEWVESGGGGHDGSDTSTTSSGHEDSSGGHIHADMPDGEVDAGVATIDTDHDGHNDTAVVETKSGGTIAFTDKDGDGEADIAVQIGADGTTTTFEHTGHGEWTEVPGGSGSDHVAADPAGDAEWGGAGSQTLAGVAHIDSGTGQWISPN